MKWCAPALLCLLWWPSVAGAATCERRERGPRYVLVHGEGYGDGPTRTSLAACDRRTGRRWTLAEGRFAAGDRRRPARGVRIDRENLTGTVATWAEVRSDARGLRAHAASVDLARRGARPRRILLARTTVRRAPPTLQAAPLGRSGLAFLVWADAARPEADLALVARRPGQRDAVVARGVFAFDVEDGTTLSWFPAGPYVPGPAPAPVFRDLAPLPSRDGCPVRSRFRAHRRFGDLVITVSRRRDFDVFRACVLGSGRDAVIGAGGDFGTFGNGRSLRVVAGAGRVVALVSEQFSRYNGCESSTVRTLDVVSVSTLRSADARVCVGAPPRGVAAVVTSAGAAAWISGGRVLALSRDNVIAELDRGDVSGLRADGERVVWTYAGAERSAVP